MHASYIMHQIIKEVELSLNISLSLIIKNPLISNSYMKLDEAKDS